MDLLRDDERMDVAGALAAFARDGYARLGRAMSDACLEALRTRADDLMLGRVAYPGMFFQLDSKTGAYEDLTFGLGYQGPSYDYRKIEKLEKDELFLGWLRNPLFQEIAQTLLGASVTLYRAILMNKSVTGGTVLPWHQDGGQLWGLDREPALQIWTALDDVPLSAGALEVLPGSHLDGLATPLGGMVPEPMVRARGANERCVALPARAGEVVLLHNHVWHRSLVNQTGQPRRAFSVCYMSADTRCTRRKRAPREFFQVF